MKKLIIIVATTLIATASSYAQNLPGRNPESTTVQNDMRDPDPVRREERQINARSRELGSLSRNPESPRRRSIPTFEARIVVTNNDSRTIKSISWIALLTDPNTGVVIGKYNITTDTRIAPGKSKRLEKKLPAPTTYVVNATSPDTVGNLTTTVTSIAYEDGSTSDKP